MLTVLGRANSINVRKVLWLCEEIGVAHEREDWGRGFRSTDTPEFLALNPNGLVPVIRDGDFVLWESHAILRYLAAKHGRDDLLPADPASRAIVEQWMEWYSTDVGKSFNYAFHGLVRKAPDFADPALIEASVRNTAARMGMIAAQIERAGGHIAGPAFTLADIPFGLAVNRWFMLPVERPELPVERPELPALAAYYERLSERPPYRAHGRNGMA